MTARTHDLAAITALGVVALAIPLRPLSLVTVIAAIFANLIGGIAPDIDQPTAPFWRNLPILRFFGRYFDNFMGGHRFLTHSILGMALFGFAAHWFILFFHPLFKNADTGYIWWAFMIGMFSHLVMDSLTKEGVPWLLPIPVKFGFPPIRKLRITTGKWMEALVVFPGLIAFNAFFLYANYPKLLELIQHYVAR